MQVDLEHFEDTITLNIYEEPVIIPSCGHTFDRSSLLKILDKKCPLCRTEFAGNPDDFPINWTICEILNLDINMEEKIDDISNFDAKKARYACDEFMNNEAREHLKTILVDTRNLAKKGESRYKFKQIDHQEIKSRVINLLQKKQFTVNTLLSGELSVTW